MSWNVSSSIDILLDPAASESETIDARETMAKFTKEEQEEFERRWREAGRATASYPLSPNENFRRPPDSINFRFCENGEWPVMEG